MSSHVCHFLLIAASASASNAEALLKSQPYGTFEIRLLLIIIIVILGNFMVVYWVPVSESNVPSLGSLLVEVRMSSSGCV